METSDNAALFYILCILVALAGWYWDIVASRRKREKAKSFTMHGYPHGKYLTPIAPFAIKPQPTRTLYVAGGIDLPEKERVDAGEFVIQSADVVDEKVCVVARNESGYGVIVYFPAAAFEGIEMCELIGCVLTYSIRLEPDHN